MPSFHIWICGYFRVDSKCFRRWWPDTIDTGVSGNTKISSCCTGKTVIISFSNRIYPSFIGTRILSTSIWTQSFWILWVYFKKYLFLFLQKPKCLKNVWLSTYLHLHKKKVVCPVWIGFLRWTMYRLCISHEFFLTDTDTDTESGNSKYLSLRLIRYAQK